VLPLASVTLGHGAINWVPSENSIDGTCWNNRRLSKLPAVDPDVSRGARIMRAKTCAAPAPQCRSILSKAAASFPALA
jgi:hypothetical protein